MATVLAEMCEAPTCSITSWGGDHFHNASIGFLSLGGGVRQISEHL